MALEPPSLNFTYLAALGMKSGFEDFFLRTSKWCLRSMAVERMMEASCLAGAWSCGSGSDVRYESTHLRRNLCFSDAASVFEVFASSDLPWLELCLSFRVCLILRSAIPILGWFCLYRSHSC